VAALVPRELAPNEAPVLLVVEVRQQMDGLRNPAQFGQRLAKPGGTAAALERAHQLDGADRTHLERAGHPQHVIPVASHELAIDAVASEPVQWPVVGAAIEAP
jgi:hypothetical protein